MTWIAGSRGVALACLFLVLTATPAPGAKADRVVVVLIDGLRYREGLGDSSARYTPRMSALAEQGIKVEPFLNDGRTITRHAIPTSWMGGWFGSTDTVYAGSPTQYANAPTFFEAYRKDLARPAEDCVYFLKTVSGVWRQSFDAAYGPDYWPQVHMQGSTDSDVWNAFRGVAPALQPRFVYLYLADVDHAGHSGLWQDYVHAIEVADGVVGDLWDYLQSDPFYAGRTDLLVTNDHGRHDDAHGGFAHHGDGCAGCRTMMLLAVGPDFPPGVVSHTARTLPDLAPTVAHILGFEMPWARGEVMAELFEFPVEVVEPVPPYGVGPVTLSPNPSPGVQTIDWVVARPGAITLDVVDVTGRRRVAMRLVQPTAGHGRVLWDGTDDRGERLPAGIYFVRVMQEGKGTTARTVLLP